MRRHISSKTDASVLLLTHESHLGGIGTFVRGLEAALRTQVSASAVEVVAYPGPEGVARSLGARGGMHRALFEQVVTPAASRRHSLIHNLDHRAVLVRGRRSVITVHDLFFFDHPEWFGPGSGAYKRAALRASLKARPAAVICVSEFTRLRLLDHFPWFPEDRVHVISPGVDGPSTPRDQDLVELREPYFLTVAAIEPRKNHLTILEALRIARRAGFQLRWKVVGAVGWGGEQIVARLRDEEGVEVLGWVPRTELEQLYAGARFVVSPSLAEGFGFPPLEAMRRGVPTICSTGSAYDEVVGNAALAIDPVNPGEWATAMCRLEEDPALRAELTHRGLGRSTCFTWDKAASRHLHLYERLAA